MPVRSGYSGLPFCFRPIDGRRRRRGTGRRIAAKIAQPWLLVADHAAEQCWSAPRRSRRSSTIWTKFVTARVGFSKGCAALALKKPPPLVPSILIATWLATGPSAIVCFAPSSVRGVDIGAERLRDALPDVGTARQTGCRAAAARRACNARDIDPERCRSVRADARENPRMIAMAIAMPVAAERKFWWVRPSIWVRYEIGRFTAVVLPVGVGDEARRRVEGEALFHRRLSRGIERQHALKPEDRVQDHEAEDVEQHDGGGVAEPVLLLVGANAGDAIEAALERRQHRRQERAFAGEDAEQVAAERPGDQRDDDAEDDDLRPAVEGHGSDVHARPLRTARRARARR